MTDGAELPLVRPGKGHKYMFEYRGALLTTSELARIAGLHPRALRSRLYKGWSVERAVNTPAHEKVARTPQNIPDDPSYYAAFSISKTVSGSPHEQRFRCIRPGKEYAFDGDSLCYMIRFDAADTARLVAFYKESGIASSLNRLYKVDGKTVKEIRA